MLCKQCFPLFGIIAVSVFYFQKGRKIENPVVSIIFVNIGTERFHVRDHFLTAAFEFHGAPVKKVRLPVQQGNHVTIVFFRVFFRKLIKEPGGPEGTNTLFYGGRIFGIHKFIAEHGKIIRSRTFREAPGSGKIDAGKKMADRFIPVLHMFIDPVEALLVEDVEVLGKGRIMTLGTYGQRIDQRMNFSVFCRRFIQAVQFIREFPGNHPSTAGHELLALEFGAANGALNLVARVKSD